MTFNPETDGRYGYEPEEYEEAMKKRDGRFCLKYGHCYHHHEANDLHCCICDKIRPMTDKEIEQEKIQYLIYDIDDIYVGLVPETRD